MDALGRAGGGGGGWGDGGRGGEMKKQLLANYIIAHRREVMISKSGGC